MEFAQSREDDDLFADDFEPASAPTIVEEAPIVITGQPAAKAPQVKSGAQRASPPRGESNNHERKNNNRDRGNEKRRGGRGRGAAANNGLNSSRYASQEPEAAVPSTAESTPSTEQAPSGPSETAGSASDAHLQANKPVPSVRGDRSLTGGPSHKKLTEEELTAKLERMKIINAEKSKSFQKSEEDRAGYAEKVEEERQMATRRVMEGERMKNRERKLKAMGGREWDEGKDEKDFEDKKGRSSQYVRGGHGGVIRGRGGLAGSRYNDEPEENGYSGGSDNYRGRGSNRGRGGRGRDNNARGGRGAASPRPQTVPAPEDFPSLPTPSKSMNITKSDPKSPLAGAGDWADEMSTPVEAKKVDVE
ncbi:hypothetical protein ACMFMG_007101 [Clarireedia jacksonii]